VRGTDAQIRQADEGLGIQRSGLALEADRNDAYISNLQQQTEALRAENDSRMRQAKLDLLLNQVAVSELEPERQRKANAVLEAQLQALQDEAKVRGEYGGRMPTIQDAMVGKYMKALQATNPKLNDDQAFLQAWQKMNPDPQKNDPYDIYIDYLNYQRALTQYSFLGGEGAKTSEQTMRDAEIKAANLAQSFAQASGQQFIPPMGGGQMVTSEGLANLSKALERARAQNITLTEEQMRSFLFPQPTQPTQ
jgi:hypothetical protein